MRMPQNAATQALYQCATNLVRRSKESTCQIVSVPQSRLRRKRGGKSRFLNLGLSLHWPGHLSLSESVSCCCSTLNVKSFFFPSPLIRKT